MSRASTWKTVLAIAVLTLTVGCASSPPRELVQRNDHAGLIAWYQEEARELRMKAEDMRQMAKYYATPTPKLGQQSSLVQHCNNLVEKYTKAAEELEALAKLHDEERKIP